MALRWTTSDQEARLHGVKLCVHGRSGAGKTTLIKTLPNPIIISAESGMLALGDVSIPTLALGSFNDLDQAYQFLSRDPRAKQQFESVALDSITEIAEQCLSHEKGRNKDGRAAYGEMNDEMAMWIRKFRDLPGFHVYFSAKQGRVTDDVTNVTRYGPDMPGRTLTGQMPYFFDETFALEIGKTPEGKEFRYLLTNLTLTHECKDRSGALDLWEPPDLGHVIRKIQARQAAQQTGETN